MSSVSSFTSTLRSFQIASEGMNRILERLATGERINRGSDGPAALVSSEYLRSAITLLEAEAEGLQRADMVIATADSALGSVSGLLVDAEGLAVSAADPMLSDAEREAYQMQLDSIEGTIRRIASTSSFAGVPLFDGSLTISAAGATLGVDALSVGDLGRLDDPAGVQSAVAEARGQVTTQRGALGAFSRNTIGSALGAIGTAIEGLSTARSGIRDTDFAAEIANLARRDVLGKASLAALGSLMSIEARVIDLLA